MLPLFLFAALEQSEPSPPSARPTQIYLASIAGIALAERDRVERFAIDTWGVNVLAVCRIPHGWTVTAGNSAAPDGTISGEASHGVTFLRRGQQDELSDLVLIQLDGMVQPQDTRSGDTIHPATFAGYVEIGTDGIEQDPRRAPLTSVNVRLAPATGCPAQYQRAR